MRFLQGWAPLLPGVMGTIVNRECVCRGHFDFVSEVFERCHFIHKTKTKLSESVVPTFTKNVKVGHPPENADAFDGSLIFRC